MKHDWHSEKSGQLDENLGEMSLTEITRQGTQMVRPVVHTRTTEEGENVVDWQVGGNTLFQKGLSCIKKRKGSDSRWGYDLQYLWRGQVKNIRLFLPFLSNRQNVKARNVWLSLATQSSGLVDASYPLRVHFLWDSTKCGNFPEARALCFGNQYQTTFSTHMLSVPIPTTPWIGPFFAFTRTMFGSECLGSILGKFLPSLGLFSSLLKQGWYCADLTWLSRGLNRTST